MLVELKISDLAIIDNLTLATGPGLNVFTGETGAGKSIIIDAIDLVLGDRASSDMIRGGKEEAVVEAMFSSVHHGPVVKVLEEAGLPVSDNLIVKRVIQRSGRNKVYINNSLSTLMTLTEIGRHLIDICGQSQHQSLVRVEEHIELLDLFGGLGNMRHEMAESYWKFRALKNELDGLAARKGKIGEDQELKRHQSEEIGKFSLKPGEDEALVKERELLRNAERLTSVSSDVERTLYSAEGSIVERLGRVVRGLNEISGYDETLKDTAKSLEAVLFEIEDKATFLRDYSSAIEGDPDRLEEVEARLDGINKLKRKYGATIEDVLRTKEEIDKSLAGVGDLDARLKELGARLGRAREEAALVAQALTAARREKVVALKEGIISELEELGMKGVTFEVVLTTDIGEDSIPNFGEKGADRVEFYISTNPGEEVKPLSKVASGGELSRIMLALKGLTAVGKVPTLIFDEVDTGIGGSMADVVARKLMKASTSHQVMCITHLPQIAVFADSHYSVSKSATSEGRTVTTVKKLDDKERVEHVARMLGGTDITDITRKHAREMLKGAGKSV